MSGPPRLPRERVRAFWRARVEGLPVADAAKLVGVSESGARGWIAESGAMIPDLTEPTGRYLGLAEREEIAVLWAAGLNRAEIARRTRRHRSTIGRELTRNRARRRDPRTPRPDGRPHPRGPVPGTERGRDRPQHEQLRYRALLAQSKTDQRARRAKPTKLDNANPELCALIQTWLTRKWSPAQIAATLRRDFPDRPEMWVSHETIYQELYVQGRGHLRRELSTCLRTGRALRRPHRLPDQRRRRPTPAPEIMISSRPAEATDRAVPGHWEGDLIIGKDGLSAIGTLVERSTRFTMLLHLPGRHTPDQPGRAERLRDAMITAMHGLPATLRRSMAWDQGSEMIPEMSGHGQIRMALDMPVYFCDPHSPWQRGSNENTNGLLRQYFPKGTDLSRHSASHLAWAADELNDRPRATLGFHSPARRMIALLSNPQELGGVATTP
jgi:transposase, IS30 family